MRVTQFGLVFVSFALGCTGLVGGESGTGLGPDGTQATDPAHPGNPSDPATSTDATGHYALRRLTNQEYTNTVQALLFTKQTPGTAFQESLPGSSGYTNDSAALDISSALVASYYAAATALAKEVIASKGSAGGAYSTLVTCDAPQAACTPRAGPYEWSRQAVPRARHYRHDEPAITATRIPCHPRLHIVSGRGCRDNPTHRDQTRRGMAASLARQG